LKRLPLHLDELAVKLTSDSSELKLGTGMMLPDEWIHRGLEFSGKAWDFDLKTETGEGQEERSKTLRTSSNDWT
jgi:hypothetical protein